MIKKGYISDLTDDEKLFISIVRLGETFKKKSTQLFRNFGLTFSQYTVLRILADSENEQNTISNVSKLLFVSSPNMSDLAKRMEKKGFLIRKGDPQDERVTILVISSKGKTLLKKISDENMAFVSYCFSDFSSNERTKLFKKCRDIYRKIKDGNWVN